MNDKDIVHGKAIARFQSDTLGSRRRGDPIRTTVAQARHLISLGVAEFDLSNLAGPAETKPAGPKETKEEGSAIAAKKSSGAPQAGRSIGLLSSSALGSGIRSLFSAAGRVLPRATAFAASAPASIAKVIRSRS